ncbi:MAG: LSM domain-containing protein [Patescibacteria group bacterium]|nr:LSM domain-containing protein [Patescibacteria group bacterium]
MEQMSRPLDALNKSRGKRVIVDLKNGWRYVGKLQAFDIHINTVLEEAEEYEPKNKKILTQIDEKVSEETIEGDKVLKRKLGTIFIRGDAITNISVQ